MPPQKIKTEKLRIIKQWTDLWKKYCMIIWNYLTILIRLISIIPVLNLVTNRFSSQIYRSIALQILTIPTLKLDKEKCWGCLSKQCWDNADFPIASESFTLKHLRWPLKRTWVLVTVCPVLSMCLQTRPFLDHFWSQSKSCTATVLHK